METISDRRHYILIGREMSSVFGLNNNLSCFGSFVMIFCTCPPKYLLDYSRHFNIHVHGGMDDVRVQFS